MKSITILGLAVAAMLLSTPACEAARGRVFFGKNETLHRLADVPLKGPDGEALALSFKTSTLFLGLGLYCKDDGYVLAKASDPSFFLPMPAAETIPQMQAAGLLPQPLPSYKVPAWDYVVGYSLWWVALLGAGFLALKERLARKKAAPPASVLAVR
jgi:hypothetical protein